MKRQSMTTIRIVMFIMLMNLTSPGFSLWSAAESAADPDLFAAVRKGDLQAVKQLVREHPELVNVTGKDNTTPLHESGSRAIAELLIGGGAAIDTEDKYIGTPLHKAAFYANQDVAELLIAQGADVNAKNRLDGKTALHIVAWGALTDFMELLIANGADLNAKDNYGRTALHYAAQFGHTKSAKLLVAKGAKLDIQDLHFGKTPLHWGVEWGSPDRWEVIDLLIAKGAALNVKNNFAMTPLDYAIKNGRTELAALLRKHGAKPGR